MLPDASVCLAPDGAPADPAITWRGRTIGYAELDRLIDAAPAGGLDPVDLVGMDLPAALACAFAASRAGSAVLVRDPTLPAPALGALPAGTWLVASTSGSTATPRAVCRTAESWAASVRPLAELAGLSSAARVLLTGPLHATLHLHAAMHTLAIGAELTDDRGAATAVHAVPTVLDTLVRELPGHAPLRTAVVAGAAFPEALAKRLRDRGISVTEYYGAAELSFVAARRLPDSALLPFPEVQVRLDAGGVLWARSPYLALGYAGSGGDGDRGDRTRRPGDVGGGARRVGVAGGRTNPLRTDAAGYATVGDLASAPDRDPAHGLVMRGRGDATVTTGGFTVLAEDVEAALAALPGVRAVAVVGMPHPHWGEIVTAVLDVEPGADVSRIPAAARHALTGPARPRRYLIADALPRTGGGKVARAAVRDGLLADTLPVRPLRSHPYPGS